MLTLDTRSTYRTLLDAAVLRGNDPDKPAVVFFDGPGHELEITRAEFAQQAAGWCHRLLAADIQPGDFVAIAHGQKPAVLLAFWGAILAGAIPSIFSPLTEKLDPERYFDHLSRLVEIAGAACFLVSNDLVGPLSERVSCPVMPIEGLEINFHRDHIVSARVPDPAAIAFLQHSSGTTGLQKGVTLTHEGVLNQIASLSSALKLEDDEVVVSWLPLYHDMGLIAGFLLPLIQGLPLVLLDPFDWARRPVQLFQAITAYKGTRCWLPNFAYNHLARRVRKGDINGLDLSSMRQFINCSEPVRADSHELFLQKFRSIGVTDSMLGTSYAMAENTFAVTQSAPGNNPPTDPVDQLGVRQAKLAIPVNPTHHQAIQHVSCGRVIPHTEIKITDDSGLPLEDRQIGEIWVRSNCQLAGYFHRPDLNPFVDGWYQTGDIGYTVSGELYVIGRQKDIIINAGKNIFPQDIEAIVNEIPGLHPGRNAVFGVFDDKEGTELIAVVAEFTPEKTPDDLAVAALKKEIRARVAQQTLITVSFADIVPPQWLIKTSSGKIARGANRDKWLAQKRG